MTYHMKKIPLLLLSAVLSLLPSFGQAVPSIMVIPSDSWCNDNGFLTEIDNNGVKM